VTDAQVAGGPTAGSGGPGQGPRRAGGAHPGAGYVEVLAAASLWGSSGIFSVALFRAGVPPESVALLRPLAGLLFLVGGALLFRRRALQTPRRGLLVCAGVGGAATALFQVAYQMSTDAVGVPTTVALLYLAPALVLAGAGPLIGERPTRRQIVLGAVSVCGVWLTVTGARGASISLSPAGLGWGLSAAAAYAGYTLFGRYASPRWGSVATVLHSTWGACLILLVAVPVGWGPVPLPTASRAWVLLALYGLLTIAVAAFLFYDALGRVPAGHVSILATAEPVVAALLATVLLDQGLTPAGWVGLCLVVLGVAGASARPPRVAGVG